MGYSIEQFLGNVRIKINEKTISSLDTFSSEHILILKTSMNLKVSKSLKTYMERAMSPIFHLKMIS